MNVGDSVRLRTYGYADRESFITAKGVPSGIGSLTAYKIEYYGLRFYMKPELDSRKYMNAGNRAYWIEPIE